MTKKAVYEDIIFVPTSMNNPVFNILCAGHISGASGEHEISLSKNASSYGYLVSGNVEIVSSGASFKVSEKEIFFIGSAASSNLKLKVSANAFGYWFTSDGTLPDALAAAYSIPVVSIKSVDANVIMSNMKDCLQYTSDDNYMDSMKQMSRYFFDFLLLCAFDDVSSPAEKSQKKVSEADRIRTYIDNTIYSNITLDDVKNHFGITKMHAIRVFKAKYSITPIQYAIRRRVEIASTLLATTDLSIKAISEMLHYSNTQHFSNTFKKLVGTSPNKYRSDIKKSNK